MDSIYSLSIQYQQKHQENTKEQNHIKLPASHAQPPPHDLFGAASTALAFAHGAWRAPQSANGCGCAWLNKYVDGVDPW